LSRAASPSIHENPVCLFLTGVLLLPFGLSGADAVVISEFMASNARTLADEDGSYSD